MFFSVKLPMNIGDKPYRPCICYPLPKALEATVSKLVAEGKADVYEDKQFFCNGKIIEKKKKSKKSSAKKEEVTPSVKETVEEEKAVEEGF